MAKFSLINVSDRNDNCVSGNWLQNHVGTKETALKKARETERANSNRIQVAIVEEISSVTPGYFSNLVEIR